VPKSQLVREAVFRYLEEPSGGLTAEEAWERMKPFVGIVEGNPELVTPEELADHIYRQNFRE
jgi:hypothetical protein